MSSGEPAPSSYRRRCLNEKGEVCEICGSTEDIEVHHIDGDRTNARLDNLAPLCRGCHRQIHGAESSKYAEWQDKLTEGGGGLAMRTLHLPQETRDMVDRTYKMMDIRHHDEFGESLSKSKEFYPALLRAGVNGTSVAEELGLEDDDEE